MSPAKFCDEITANDFNDTSAPKWYSPHTSASSEAKNFEGLSFARVVPNPLFHSGTPSTFSVLGRVTGTTEVVRHSFLARNNLRPQKRLAIR